MSVYSERKLDTLAVDGGKPYRSSPWTNRFHFGFEEKVAVEKVFQASLLSGTPPEYDGEEENLYCEEYATYMGGGFCDAVNSGTTAVYVALRALNLPAFSEVIVPAVNDPGGIMPIPLLNLVPIIADSAVNTYNTSLEQIKAVYSKRTSAILIPHIGGDPVNMDEIIEFAKVNGIPVIEDCSQSHGARWRGKLVGTFGDIAAISTMFGKHTCSGSQGGMVFTRNETLYKNIKRASDRGKPKFLDGTDGNVFASLNLNLGDISASIGRAQLKKLPGLIKKRREIIYGIIRGLSDIPSFELGLEEEGASSSFWWLRFSIRPEKINCSVGEFVDALKAEGLPVDGLYQALPHKMAWFRDQAVFHGTQLPWSSDRYDGEKNPKFETPNALAAANKFYRLSPSESWNETDIRDIIQIAKKVDGHFRKELSNDH